MPTTRLDDDSTRARDSTSASRAKGGRAGRARGTGAKTDREMIASGTGGETTTRATRVVIPKKARGGDDAAESEAGADATGGAKTARAAKSKKRTTTIKETVVKAPKEPTETAVKAPKAPKAPKETAVKAPKATKPTAVKKTKAPKEPKETAPKETKPTAVKETKETKETAAPAKRRPAPATAKTNGAKDAVPRSRGEASAKEPRGKEPRAKAPASSAPASSAPATAPRSKTKPMEFEKTRDAWNDWASDRHDLTRSVLPLEQSLAAWARSDGGRALAMELSEPLSCGNDRVQMKLVEEEHTGDLYVGLMVDGQAACDDLAMVRDLMEATLGDLARIRRRTAAASMLENERLKIQAEIDAGLRCEFTIGYNAMQALLLDGGEKLKTVREQCDVDRVVVDPRKRTIRIVGRSASEVARARDMLEISNETIDDVPELALRMIIGKGGAKVNDIQQRTGANISIGWEKNAVYIRGAPSAVKAAKILVKSCIKTYEVEHVEVTYEDLDEVREELSRLDMEWGGSPNVQYVRGGRGRPHGPRSVA